MNYRSGFRPDLFAGKTVLVAGGGGGIGRCIAHELASLGAAVILAGRTEEKLQKTRDEITTDGGKVVAHYALELREEEAVTHLVAAALEHGPIDSLVNAAGGQFPAQLADLSLNGWNAVLNNNLTSYFLTSRELYRQCMQERGGCIVNIGAEWSNGMPGMAHNGAARAGLSNLTASAATEWARSGVRVNCVIPGFIATTGLDRYPEEDWDALRQIDRKIPLGRHGTAAEISAMTTFLLSDMGAYITGADFRVDGGMKNGAGGFLFSPGESRNKLIFNGFHRDEPPELLR